MKSSRKRTAHSRPKHKHTKEYLKHYYPYLPLFLSIGLLFVALLLPVRQNPPINTQSPLSSVNADLVTETNNARLSAGSQPLSFNNDLASAAQAKADDMVRRNYWDHTTPDGNEPWTFIENTGYGFSSAGENLAQGFNGGSQIVNAWLSSETHRDNLLSSAYSEVGFGTSTSNNFTQNGPTTVTVAMYAAPKGSGSVNQETTQVLGANKQVAFIESISGNSNFALLIAVVIAIGTTYFLISHTVLAHHVIQKSGNFIRKHPLIDSLVLIVISIGIVLIKQAGSIY